MSMLRITFIGTGSTIFVKSILGNMFHRKALKTARIALMDIDPTRLEESHIVMRKLIDSAGVSGKVTCHTQRKEALQDADFVVVAFQIDGYEPCTVIDFEVYKRHGLEQIVADTLGPGGIMRTLRTTPHLRQVYKDMTKVCPDATMLNHVNPVTINIWAMYTRYPHIKQVGLCHSMQGMAEELARGLNIDPATLRYRYADINRMTPYLELECRTADGSYVNLYPELLATYEAGQAPKPNIRNNICCQNIVRYEMFKKLGYFVTESSEHFAEYTPWFIKPGREDLIGRHKVPLDEYPKRCVEQLANWYKEPEGYKNASRTDIESSRGYANTIMNVVQTGEPSVIYDNVRNDGLIDNLPQECCVEVTCLVNASSIQSTRADTLPSHLAALVQTNTNVQTLPTEAILIEDRDRIYHIAMMDPHTVAVLGIDEIYALAGDLIAAHGG